jgi:hypothetical protein
MLFDKFNGQDVFVWLDPDADKEAIELAQHIKGRLILSPMKIDDAINKGYISKRDIYHMMIGARNYK